MSILATVKERSGKLCACTLILTRNMTPPNTKYFTYAIESSFIYCMPGIGARYIYFPSDEETQLRFMQSGYQEGETPEVLAVQVGHAQKPGYKSFPM